MGNLTFGDGVVLGICLMVLCLAVYLILTSRVTAPVERMPKPRRAAVAVQAEPMAKPDGETLPIYEHVAGDLLGMADALDNRNYTAQIEQIVADLEARAQHGAIKYGQHLYAYNGRDMTIDAYQEALDLLQYAKGRQIEAEDMGLYDMASLAVQVQAHATNALLRLHDMMRLTAAVAVKV